MLLSLVLAAGGCGTVSGPHQQVVSPRVVGQVVDGVTGQPIAQVTVRRNVPPQERKPDYERKGGERMMEPSPARTDSTGRFDLPSTKVFSLLFDSGGFSSVRLTIEHPRYVTLHTNCVPKQATGADPQAAPLLDAGVIALMPLRQ